MIYDSNQSHWTNFRITANAILAGMEAMGPNFSQTKFDVVLDGPELESITPDAIRAAFEGAKVNVSSFSFVVGSGISVGTLTVGGFCDPRSVVANRGFGIGYTGFEATAHVSEEFSSGFSYP